MYSEAQKRATMKWKKENVKRVEINLNKETDADVIEYLEGKNVQGEFKRTMRARVERSIFTNHEINLIKSCIDLRINELTDYIEDEEETIRTDTEVMNKAKANGIDQVVERKQKQIGKAQASIKKMSKEVDELKQLREYIDGTHYE